MKVALIGGFGHQGYVINGMKDLEGCQLVAVAGSEPGEDISNLVKTIETNIGRTPAIYETWRDMLDREKPDIVGVSPMFCHHQAISIECLKRNIHVMCEKPVALNLQQLKELQDAYADSNAEFVGMHAMRYHPDFRAAYEAVKRGDIGRPLLINSQKSYAFSMQRPLFYKKREQFGGTICWVAMHAIDWSYWIMGDFSSIFAVHTTIGNMGYDSCESSGVIAFACRNGGQGSINFDFLKAHKDPVAQDRVRIAGDKGVIEVYNQKAYIVTHDAAPQELELKPAESFFKDFVLGIKGEVNCLLNAADTFAVTRLALLARDSADSGQSVKV